MAVRGRAGRVAEWLADSVCVLPDEVIYGEEGSR